MAGTLHDGLGALEREVGIEPLHHPKIPVTVEQKAKFS